MVVKKTKGGWTVMSHKTGRKSKQAKVYKTKPEAERRLKQISYWKNRRVVD